MSQAQANVWVYRLSGVLNQALGKEQQLPDHEPAKLEAVLNACTSGSLVMKDEIKMLIQRAFQLL